MNSNVHATLKFRRRGSRTPCYHPGPEDRGVDGVICRLAANPWGVCMKGRSCAISGLLVMAQLVGAQSSELGAVRELAEEGHFTEAMEGVDRILGDEPESSEALFVKGIILAGAGRADEAERIFLKLTRRHPEAPEPFNNLAVIYARQGDYERSVDILRQALQTSSSYGTAFENLTKVYGKLAGQAYDRALGQESSTPSAGPALRLLTDLGSITRDRTAPPTAVGVREPLPEPEPEPEAEPELELEPEAEAVVVAPSPPPEPEFDAAELVFLVREWARAWAEQRAESFLSFYASDFSPAQGISRATWAAERRQRIRRKLFIRVEVESIGVRQLEGGRAQVRFLQSYWSDTSQDRVVKTFDLVRENGAWKILHEVARSE
ncbi:MAG: tetratricopeptide repeat protein [Acidobacteria bacterium]|nr:tetratricopeptide repeat protein [Acidobacteriota bacterium]